jgi:hypothetical protein
MGIGIKWHYEAVHVLEKLSVCMVVPTPKDIFPPTAAKKVPKKSPHFVICYKLPTNKKPNLNHPNPTEF